ncbi:neuronal acetylcholine receptor subunit alpha-3-like [Ruditapes philippinarum]|uniref:neuronal acetylcholine receptor subunit alpha-3-like n=1 Tax=Ruditapes philippinarum TaxID=129788 RepID=UPI00295AC956|nr:neuronal acetylcholine receptor subunit alpha-3-like [Ruditapes philippinarum]
MIPTVKLKSSVDITYYPYDKQKCEIHIASWGYTDNEVALETPNVPVNLADFETHGEWEITSSSTVITYIVETLDDGTVRQFPEIQFLLFLGYCFVSNIQHVKKIIQKCLLSILFSKIRYISLFFSERRSGYYNLNVIMPIILTSLLVALTFIVPVECGEKLSYILTVFLSLAVLLTLVADSMPSTSITTSVLGLYLALVTVLSAVGILITVFILILFNKPGVAKSNSCIMKVTRFAAKITCSLKLTRDSRMNSVSPASDEEGDSKISKSDATCDVTWRDVAIVLDRLCFLVFTIVTILMNLSFVIALVGGGKASEP